MTDDRLDRALALIDAANREDPNQEASEEGAQPAALLYGQRMSRWLARLRPDAPEALMLAARAQHIQRWKIPRSTYPAGRTGYLQWRKALTRFHAETAGALLRDAGYDEDTVQRVAFLIEKRQLTRDADTATLEDAACLVFLEHHIDAFARKTEREKLVEIVRKTWTKMTPQGQEHARKLAYSAEVQGVIQDALAE